MKKNGKIMTIIVIVVLIIILVPVISFLLYRGRYTEMAVPEGQYRPPQLQVQVQEPQTEDSDMNEPQPSYIEHQVLALADSKREAKQIAKAVGGELLSYDNQVAVIQIGMTVEEMMQMLEEDPTLPKVYPNYQNYQSYTIQ